jgi:hypothetical protein
MLSRSRSVPWCVLVLALVVAGCRDDPAATASTSSSATAGVTGRATAMSAPGAAGFRLETQDETNETPTGKLPDKLLADGPAAAFISNSPLPEGPRKYLALYVFPRGTDPAIICDSDFPGPKKKNEYVLGLDLQYDGELKVGPAVSLGSPCISYVSKSDNGNVSASAVGKPKFVDIQVTAATADSVSIVAKAKPGAPFKLDASFTAKLCKAP